MIADCRQFPTSQVWICEHEETLWIKITIFHEKKTFSYENSKIAFFLVFLWSICCCCCTLSRWRHRWNFVTLKIESIDMWVPVVEWGKSETRKRLAKWKSSNFRTFDLAMRCDKTQKFTRIIYFMSLMELELEVSSLQISLSLIPLAVSCNCARNTGLELSVKLMNLMMDENESTSPSFFYDEHELLSYFAFGISAKSSNFSR